MIQDGFFLIGAALSCASLGFDSTILLDGGKWVSHG